MLMVSGGYGEHGEWCYGDHGVEVAMVIMVVCSYGDGKL